MGNPVNMLFTLKFSSYMAFMCDLETDRLYLQNFLNGNIYNDKNSNIPDQINLFDNNASNLHAETRNQVTETKSYDPSIHFQTTTNFEGKKSKSEFDVEKKVYDKY